VPIGSFYIIVFYILYRIAIIFHIRSGEYYKAVFDAHRDKLLDLIKIPDQKELTPPEEFRSYSQYLLLRCSSCGNYFQRSLDKCKLCGTSKTKND
jgi:hypothetical protein